MSFIFIFLFNIIMFLFLFFSINSVLSSEDLDENAYYYSASLSLFNFAAMSFLHECVILKEAASTANYQNFRRKCCVTSSWPAIKAI